MTSWLGNLQLVHLDDYQRSGNFLIWLDMVSKTVYNSNKQVFQLVAYCHDSLSLIIFEQSFRNYLSGVAGSCLNLNE